MGYLPSLLLLLFPLRWAEVEKWIGPFLLPHYFSCVLIHSNTTNPTFHSCSTLIAYQKSTVIKLNTYFKKWSAVCHLEPNVLFLLSLSHNLPIIIDTWQKSQTTLYVYIISVNPIMFFSIWSKQLIHLIGTTDGKCWFFCQRDCIVPLFRKISAFCISCNFVDIIDVYPPYWKRKKQKSLNTKLICRKAIRLQKHCSKA